MNLIVALILTIKYFKCHIYVHTHAYIAKFPSIFGLSLKAYLGGDIAHYFVIFIISELDENELHGLASLPLDKLLCTHWRMVPFDVTLGGL